MAALDASIARGDLETNSQDLAQLLGRPVTPLTRLLERPGAGLRERKKARTRRLIADTAARLFAERGYEHVAVSDVAREAEVAEQTVLKSVAGIRGIPPEIAKLQGIALAGVFQIIISEAGRRTVEGQSQAKIADELYPVVQHMLDELDRWLSA